MPVPMLWVLGITLLFGQTDDTHAEDVYGIPVKCANEGFIPSAAHYGYCLYNTPVAYTADIALEEIFEFPRFKASKLQSVSDAFIYVIVPPHNLFQIVSHRDTYMYQRGFKTMQKYKDFLKPPNVYSIFLFLL